MSARFKLGQLLVTPKALRSLGADGVAQLVARHAAGDWGVLTLEDKEANELALRRGLRVISAYEVDR